MNRNRMMVTLVSLATALAFLGAAVTCEAAAKKKAAKKKTPPPPAVAVVGQY